MHDPIDATFIISPASEGDQAYFEQHPDKECRLRHATKQEVLDAQGVEIRGEPDGALVIVVRPLFAGLHVRYFQRFPAFVAHVEPEYIEQLVADKEAGKITSEVGDALLASAALRAVGGAQ
jgi:hypothetical protein